MLATTTFNTPTSALSTAQQEEAEAVRLATAGRFIPRLRLAHGALRKLMSDPDDTEQVFVLSIALNAGRLPEFMARFLANDDGLDLLTRRAAIDKASVDYDALRALSADTLGGAYVRFLDDNGLDPDLFQAPPGLPRAPAYIAQRMRQTHDIWHVVTGYDPSLAGEIPLLAFIYAQTAAPAMGLLAAVGAVRHSLEIGNIFGRVWRGYQAGKRAQFLGNVTWESMWELPLTEVRDRLGVTAAA